MHSKRLTYLTALFFVDFFNFERLWRLNDRFFPFFLPRSAFLIAFRGGCETVCCSDEISLQSPRWMPSRFFLFVTENWDGRERKKIIENPFEFFFNFHSFSRTPNISRLFLPLRRQRNPLHLVLLIFNSNFFFMKISFHSSLSQSHGKRHSTHLSR